MKCKHCSAPLKKGTLICPTCGGDNSGPVQENTWKKPLIAVIAVVLVLGIGAALFFGLQASAAKSSYTGTKDQLLAAQDVVVATAGDKKLTNGELQVAYWTMIYEFLNSYGDYAPYIMDFTKPLDQQTIPDSDMTWQQYFLEMALVGWHRYAVLVSDAEAAGVEMSDGLKTYFDTLYEEMEKVLPTYNFSTVAALLANDFGEGCDFSDYESYMKIYSFGTEYYGTLYESKTFTDPELEAYYAIYQQNFEEAGYSKTAGNTVDVRHILLSPNKEKDATKETFTEEEWAACLIEAEALLAQWEANGTVEYFAELAKEYSTCPSAADGGLIAGISKGQMVEEFDAWAMSADRVPGEYGLVRTMYGYHLVYYVGNMPIWRQVALSNLRSEAMTEYMTQRTEEVTLNVDYSKIWLSEISLVG